MGLDLDVRIVGGRDIADGLDPGGLQRREPVPGRVVRSLLSGIRRAPVVPQQGAAGLRDEGSIVVEEADGAPARLEPWLRSLAAPQEAVDELVAHRDLVGRRALVDQMLDVVARVVVDRAGEVFERQVRPCCLLYTSD